jgi:nucleotide-binding universal stress UspA family protein
MTTILVASDLSGSSVRAIRRAALVARATGAALGVLHVLEGEETAARPGLARALAEAGVGPDAIEILPGDPYAVIADAARDAALLVLGEPRRRTIGELFTGTTAERIMRRVATPILMVRGEARQPYRRLLFPVDFSAVSLSAAQVAAGLGLGAGACVAVHAYGTPQIDLMLQASAFSMDDVRRHIADERDRVETKLARLLARAGMPCRAVGVPIETTAATAILSYAKAFEADLIGLASRGQPTVARRVLGSVAAHVLARAEADILHVRGRVP